MALRRVFNKHKHRPVISGPLEPVCSWDADTAPTTRALPALDTPAGGHFITPFIHSTDYTTNLSMCRNRRRKPPPRPLRPDDMPTPSTSGRFVNDSNNAVYGVRECQDTGKGPKFQAATLRPPYPKLDALEVPTFKIHLYNLGYEVPPDMQHLYFSSPRPTPTPTLPQSTCTSPASSVASHQPDASYEYRSPRPFDRESTPLMGLSASEYAEDCGSEHDSLQWGEMSFFDDILNSYADSGDDDHEDGQEKEEMHGEKDTGEKEDEDEEEDQDVDVAQLISFVVDEDEDAADFQLEDDSMTMFPAGDTSVNEIRRFDAAIAKYGENLLQPDSRPQS